MAANINMKRLITVLIGWSVCGPLLAAPSAEYANYGQVNSPINIDAVVFQNFGTFDIDNVLQLTNEQSSGTTFAPTYTPFVTQDTLYFTNSGLMEGSPGFRFDTGTGTTRFSASEFYNSGTVIGLDTPSDLFLTLNAAGDSINYPLSGPQPSDVLVFATNITSTFSLEVGNLGLLQLTGSNITVANSSLIAGTVSESDPNDVTGQEDIFTASKTASYFVNPPQVYDLVWGITNGDNSLGVDPYVTPSYPPGTYSINMPIPDSITFRGGGGTFFDETSGLSAYAFTETNNLTNIFINVVFLNTNLLDTNITVSVGFGDVETQPAEPSDVPVYPDDGGTGDIVGFSVGVPDVISGTTVTNSIYFLDSGAEIAPNRMSLSVNASYVNGYSRPISFEIATSAPGAGIFDSLFGLDIIDGFVAEPTNVAFTPSLLNEPAGQFTYQTIPGTDEAIYEAQIGRDPEVLSGVYQPKLNTNFLDVVDSTNGLAFIDYEEIIGGLGTSVDLPALTNEPGRIEIRGNQVNVNATRLRAEGVVTLNASNLMNTPLATDFGNISSDLNVSSGFMTVSNIFPTNFQRLRGDITAWSGSWINFQTNTGAGSVTNMIHYHVLWLQPDLRSSFVSTILNLALRPTNTVVQDNLRVIDNSLFLAKNLTFNSSVVLTQNAGSLMPTNVPNLQNLFINTNAGLAVNNILDLGFNMSVGQSTPLGRNYTMQSVTNLGVVSATAPLMQAVNIENDGSIIASNGTIVMEANALGMGLVVTNVTNYVIAQGNVQLSANSMLMSNSQIFAGGLTGSGQGQLLLQSTATGQIADFVPGVPSTNTPLINFWQVTDGFSLPVKPATGDLFGTEIVTIATNYTQALHTWAGIDVGPVAAGFADNMVIGHLKLSRQSPNALLHFTGAGTQNGMYVDYLELDTNSLSYSDYRDGLVIDPNLTIYFAAANVNPIKLEEVYSNRLIWVTNFTGPNSTVAVPYFNSTNFCFMNTNVATSPDISFFPPVPNSDNQPCVLNDPNNPTNFISCPTDIQMLRDLSASAPLESFDIQSGSGSNVSVVITTVGRGTIAPALKQSQVAVGKKYALTAVAAAGWNFSGWSASGLPDTVDTSSATLKFTIANDLLLTANFTPKTYTLAQGVYYGLFTNSSPSPENSGWFTFTLGGSGALSGRLLIGSTNYSFSSTFPASGLAEVTAKHGSQSLDVSLNLNLSSPTGQVKGTVSNGAWVSGLLGNIAAAWTKKNPSPYAGRYTMILTNSETNEVPTGDSYGSLIVSQEGVLSVAGELADGNAFNQTAPVSTNGNWPFYAYVAKGNDILLGWLTFQEDEFGSIVLQETNLFWSKGVSSSGYYADGFMNFLGVDSSPYSIPGKNSSGLSLLNPVVILSGGGLSESLTNSLASSGGLIYSSTNLTLSIDPAVGTFTGQLKNSEQGVSLKLKGVVLQNPDNAAGFFLGTNGVSGAVLLQNQESQ